MDFTAPSSLSYQNLVSRRRSSVSSNKSFPDSAPTSPTDVVRFEHFEPAVKYVYTCAKCGFGTNLLSSYMPHSSNPCDQARPNTWGHL